MVNVRKTKREARMPTSTPTALFPGQREPALGSGGSWLGRASWSRADLLGLGLLCPDLQHLPWLPQS